MSAYTNSHCTLHPPGTSPSSTMDIDPVEPFGSQDLNIKRETSSMDDDTRMSEIPESGDAAPNGPRSTQPTSQPSTSHLDGTTDEKSETKSSQPPPPPPPPPAAAARTSSKKGTARLVKKTTRKGNGSTSRGGRSTRGGSRATAAGGSSSFHSHRNKSTASQASSPPPSGFPAASSEAGGSGDGDDDDSDHGPYCICRGPDDHRWMISCDMCDDWFHGECVKIDKAVGDALIQRYVCPRCTDNEGINVTRYKKTCSLEGCFKPARIYDDVGGARGAAEYSVFCSGRHAEEWWEQLVRSLPENRSLKAKKADLTREKFMGLLNVPTDEKVVEGEEPWRIGKKPFGKNAHLPPSPGPPGLRATPCPLLSLLTSRWLLTRYT